MSRPSIAIAFVFLLIGSVSALAQRVQPGAVVEFQYGTRQVRGKVASVRRDVVAVQLASNGRKEVVRTHASEIRLVRDPSQTRGKPRIQVGDLIRLRKGREQGKVIRIEKGLVHFTSKSRRGRSTRKSRPLHEVEKLGAETESGSETESRKERTWVDVTGKHKLKATLVAVENDVVKLRKSGSDATLEMPLAKLSKNDQNYLASLNDRAAEFRAPSGLAATSAAVSRSEKFAVIGHGTKSSSTLETLVLLDLSQDKKWRNIRVPKLSRGECWAVSDDGKYALTSHQAGDADATKYCTIWDCGKPKAVELTKVEMPASDGSVFAASWIDDTHVFFGDSTGKVVLFKVEDGKADEVYAKQVGNAKSRRVFGVSPNGKFFVVENSAASVFEVYATSDCRKKANVPSRSVLQHVAVTNTMLIGVTPFGQTVVWDLRKKRLVGTNRMQVSNLAAKHLRASDSRMLPLSGGDAVFLRQIDGEYQFKALVNFRLGRMFNLDAPNVIAPGTNRRIWYVTEAGSKDSRFQAYTIASDVTSNVTIASN